MPSNKVKDGMQSNSLLNAKMKITLSTIGIIGSLLFGSLFYLTFGIPDSVERAGQAFIKYQVENEVKEKLGASRVMGFKEKAKALADKYQIDIDKAKKDLENDLPHKIASVIAAMCRMDCEKKKRLENSLESGYKERITTLSFAKDKLTSLIQGKYLEVVENLTRDVRIFLSSNTFLFLLLLAASFLKPQAVRHLFLPSVLLLVATVISSGIYIFGQNWFFTIIYNDYMGFGYVAYIAVIFGFLIDIIFNKAKVTTEIINAILNAIGSALLVAPC